MNNFSISTNELAESLQKSAGTLKVAGNTIDEAIALTVAGVKMPERYGNIFLLKIFNCVDYLKLYATIIGKPDYEGLKSLRYNNG